MRINFIYPLVLGLSLMAITASGKAFLDIAILKTENKYITQAIYEMHKDIKEIRKHILGK
jgi:hypothetical protein